MAKYTLLELVQQVMSSMDSDAVTSISDTVESQQVVDIIRTVYDDIRSRGDLTVNKTLFNLTASGTSLKPVLMTLPTGFDRVEWIKYNVIKTGDTDPNWIELQFLPLDQFMQMTQSMNASETTVDAMTITSADGYTLTFNYRNDKGPDYWTTFDDVTIIFDGIDKVVDTSTLQSVKTIAYGTKTYTWSATDGFVPDLQPSQFALLLNESKSLAWAEMKQTMHQKAEQAAKRNWTHLSKTRQHTPDAKWRRGNSAFEQLPNFARGGRGRFGIR